MNDRVDHVLGDPSADITLVEYGSYNCPSCCAANEVIANLRDRFGERMRYVFRHRPLTEPWSSYLVLPMFALANAGLDWSATVLQGHERLISGIVLGLVLGKPIGMVLIATLAVRLGIAFKPEEYSWRQLIAAGALAGIGFTMSLYIAHQGFPG